MVAEVVAFASATHSHAEAVGGMVTKRLSIRPDSHTAWVEDIVSFTSKGVDSESLPGDESADERLDGTQGIQRLHWG